MRKSNSAIYILKNSAKQLEKKIDELRLNYDSKTDMFGKKHVDYIIEKMNKDIKDIEAAVQVLTDTDQVFV